jgi:hypothetical protein
MHLLVETCNPSVVPVLRVHDNKNYAIHVEETVVQHGTTVGGRSSIVGKFTRASMVMYPKSHLDGQLARTWTCTLYPTWSYLIRQLPRASPCILYYIFIEQLPKVQSCTIYHIYFIEKLVRAWPCTSHCILLDNWLEHSYVPRTILHWAIGRSTIMYTRLHLFGQLVRVHAIHVPQFVFYWKIGQSMVIYPKLYLIIGQLVKARQCTQDYISLSSIMYPRFYLIGS